MSEKKTPRELLKEYFQENSADEVRKLLKNLDKKYQGSLTFKEFRSLYPLEEKELKQHKTKTILGIEPLQWRDNEANTIHGMYFLVYQTPFNHECWTANITDGLTEGYSHILGSSYKSFKCAKDACERYHRETITNIIDSFCIIENKNKIMLKRSMAQRAKD